ncbi:MAG: methyltransferase domain-containing protein [Actinomycetota bacterium]
MARRVVGGLLGADGARMLAGLGQLDRLARLDELQRLAALDGLTKLQQLDRLDELASLDRLQQLDGLGQLARLENLERELTALRAGITDHDTRLDHLRRALADEAVEARRPVYGVALPAGPEAAHWLNRCRTVQHYLEPVADLRLLDVGASAGFVAAYFEGRGATVEGWEPDPAQAELARTAGAVSGLGGTIRTQDLTAETVDVIAAGSFDAVLVLGTGAGAWSARCGPDADLVLARAVTAATQVIVETTADESRELPLFARLADIEGGVEIDRLGRLADGEGASTLWALRRRRDTVRVNGTDYPFTTRRSEAYDGSPMPQHGAGRRYYFDEGHVIKEYRLDGDHQGVNRSQILTEINVLSQLDGMTAVPELIDYELVPEQARIVMRRVPGHLLAEVLEPRLAPTEVVRIAGDVLRALVALERHGLSHNDVRSWNVIFDGRTATLIDYGLVSNLAAEVDVQALLWLVKAALTGEREDFDPRSERLPDRAHFAADPELDKLYQAVASGLTSPRAVVAAIAAD